MEYSNARVSLAAQSTMDNGSNVTSSSVLSRKEDVSVALKQKLERVLHDERFMDDRKLRGLVLSSQRGLDLHDLEKNLSVTQPCTTNTIGLPDNVRRDRQRLRGRIWKELLGVSKKKGNDALLLFLSNEKLDEPNQRVINSDVCRTRADLSMFKSAESCWEMECLLTFYCKSKALKYKQGLNEVLAPFLFLRDPQGFGIVDVYNCFHAFMTRYLPFMFQDEEFISLQYTFHLFNHLMLYHDPTLACFLADSKATPELYVTPWFLTLFASKTNIDLLLCIWDYYISQDDPYFYCFLSLALLLYHRDNLFDVEVSHLPETLSRLHFSDLGQFQEVWSLAKQLKAETPISFAHRMADSRGNKTIVNQKLQVLETDQAFMLLPTEVLRHSYGLHSSTGRFSAEADSAYVCDVARRSSVSNEPDSNAAKAAGTGVGDNRNTERTFDSHSQSGHVNVTYVPRCWKLLLFDIRPIREFAAGRLPPAIHLDITSNWLTSVLQLVGTDKDTESRREDVDCSRKLDADSSHGRQPESVFEDCTSLIGHDSVTSDRGTSNSVHLLSPSDSRSPTAELLTSGNSDTVDDFVAENRRQYTLENPDARTVESVVSHGKSDVLRNEGHGGTKQQQVSQTVIGSSTAASEKGRKVNRSVRDHQVCIMTSNDSTMDEALYAYLVLTRDINLKFVSIASGGYASVHCLAMNSGLELVDHYVKSDCVVCEPPPISRASLLWSKCPASPWLPGFHNVPSFSAPAVLSSTPAISDDPGPDKRPGTDAELRGDGVSSTEATTAVEGQNSVLPFSTIISAFNRKFRAGAVPVDQAMRGGTDDRVDDFAYNITTTAGNRFATLRSNSEEGRAGGRCDGDADFIAVVDWDYLQERLVESTIQSPTGGKYNPDHITRETGTLHSLFTFECFIERLVCASNYDASALDRVMSGYLSQDCCGRMMPTVDRLTSLDKNGPGDSCSTDQVASLRFEGLKSGSAVELRAAYNPDANRCMLLFNNEQMWLVSWPQAKNDSDTRGDVAETSEEAGVCGQSHKAECGDVGKCRTREDVSRCCRIYALHDLRRIVKITSKKSDPKLLNLYFSVADCSSSICPDRTNTQDTGDLHGDMMVATVDSVSLNKESNDRVKILPLMTLRFEDKSVAQDCIDRVRGLYRELLS
eukprot:GHVQ01032678.1.p1 GENE.GHVQ01032678.1~~GHVQ01032678.1.p1  ORF type:complete len:1152 (+),score=133.43 GHVQ01032678.1:261-3716(+)